MDEWVYMFIVDLALIDIFSLYILHSALQSFSFLQQQKDNVFELQPVVPTFYSLNFLLTWLNLNSGPQLSVLTWPLPLHYLHGFSTELAHLNGSRLFSHAATTEWHITILWTHIELEFEVKKWGEKIRRKSGSNWHRLHSGWCTSTCQKRRTEDREMTQYWKAPEFKNN